MKRIEVILFAGFLGSGKTTLLGRMLPELSLGRRTAILVNDFGKLSLDGALLKRCGVPTREIAGGSIFCVCRQADLIAQLTEIAETIRPELLLIEASGLAEPTDAAALLQNTFLREVYALPRVITTVDAVNYPKLARILPVIDKQVQIADVIVITKSDLAVTDLTHTLQARNPGAKILVSDKERLHGRLEWEPLRDCGVEAPLRLCSSATPGFSVVNWNGKADDGDLNRLMARYREVLLRAKGVFNGRHLELVNGEAVWSDDAPLADNGLFFALKGNRSREFEIDLKKIETGLTGTPEQA